jgi:hypothetical protein
MKSLVDTIWSVPAYFPYLQPPLTDEAIASAEKKIGYTLPTEFLELLRKQNGGYIRMSLPDLCHSMIAGIGPNFPSLTDFDWEECQEYVSYPLKGLVPFDGDGHWHLCLDYRKNPTNPSITYIDVECDEQTAIASSFSEYLALLRLDVGDAYALEFVSDIETLKSQLSSQLGVEFDPPDSWAHGYPTHRASLGDANKPEWLWLSHNAVPRGFVRNDHPRYEELKELMTGIALRFPELAAECYFLSTTDSVQAKVLDACAKLKIPLRPLREYVDAT